MKAMQVQSQSSRAELWPAEREGYDTPVPVAYAAIPVKRSPRHRFPIRAESRLGSVAIGVGVIWAVQVMTAPIANAQALLVTPGPLEVCGIGCLVWLHAKWRRSIDRI